MRNLKLELSFLAAVAALAPSAFAAEAPTCQTAEFSQAVTDRFPNVRDACLDIIRRDGQFYAVFKANLLRISDSGVSIRVRRSDGSTGKTQFIRTSPARFVLVDGKQVRLQDVSPNQEIMVYAKVSEPMVALLQPMEGQPVPLEPIEAAP